MKIRDNFTLRQIADEYIMIAASGDELDYTKAIALNETAAYLIKAAASEVFTAERWEALLLERYDVQADVAKADVQALIASLRKSGVIED